MAEEGGETAMKRLLIGIVSGQLLFWGGAFGQSKLVGVALVMLVFGAGLLGYLSATGTE